MHTHNVQIYYEDTDLSGVVYHANYLKYFERAREHLIGPSKLVQLLDEEQIGFVVYTASMTFKEGARLGDTIQIRSTYERTSPYRVRFEQNVYRDDVLLVEGEVEMVCVHTETGQLTKLPQW